MKLKLFVSEKEIFAIFLYVQQGLLKLLSKNTILFKNKYSYISWKLAKVHGVYLF